MKTTKKLMLIAVSTLFIMIAGGANPAGSLPSDSTMIQVPVETIVDKIRGGLLGQILGNLNGLPHEFEYYEKPGNVKNYVPSLREGARTDDDTDVEWLYIYEMQKKRKLLLSSDEIVTIWKERINDRIWNANRYARYLMDIGVKPPFTGYSVLNPWGEFNISGMFCSETFGLIAPAMPQTAASTGLNYTTTTISGEPAQQTQLFTTMVSVAFIEDDINKIIDAGIAALDPQSILLQIINDVRTWYGQYPDDWRETRKLLLKKYLQKGGNVRNTRDNNGHELHTGFAIAALLYGEGDFAETLKVAFNLGLDADNTAAAAGTILGVRQGYRNMLSQGWVIIDRYKNTSRDNMPMNETITSFADRVIEVFEMVNQENGGREIVIDQTQVYEIAAEKPAPVLTVASLADQTQSLLDKFEQEIIDKLKGTREERAWAAYMAVNLDMAESLSAKYPEQWKKAAFNLSGYWKVMDNIFHGGNLKGLDRIREKFLNAGFKTPAKEYSDNELYDDPEVWKDPAGLY